jgi:hypothetical protein
MSVLAPINLTAERKAAMALGGFLQLHPNDPAAQIEPQTEDDKSPPDQADWRTCSRNR